MKRGGLIISLDFELHWGRFDKLPLKGTEAYYHNTREVIPKLLALFAANGVKVTWATVGMLMAANSEEWEWFSPDLKPGFNSPQFSAYEWLKHTKVDSSCLFAPDLVREIIRTPGQELGSHTFAHYYTRVPGQLAGEFRADLLAAQRIAQEKFGIELRSLVFPRNQYHQEALHTARDLGFSAVRTNPGDWFWKDPEKEGWFKNGIRAADSLWPISSRTSFQPAVLSPGFPNLVPASRFFRPYQPRLSWLNRLKINRMKAEMETAAQKGEMYHLWWHPHNHGRYPEQSLQEVKIVMDHFLRCRELYGMQSYSINSYTENQLPPGPNHP